MTKHSIIEWMDSVDVFYAVIEWMMILFFNIVVLTTIIGCWRLQYSFQKGVEIQIIIIIKHYKQ